MQEAEGKKEECRPSQWASLHVAIMRRDAAGADEVK